MSVREYIELYTDGSCLKSGVGGWGLVLKQPAMGYEKEMSGSTYPTTNNRMEMTAVIEGLKALYEPCAVAVTTDSMYVCNGIMQGWAERWKKQNWVHSAGYKGQNYVPVKNADLWAQILELQVIHLVKVQWVRGHDGHPENERCDALATAASRNYVTEHSEELRPIILQERIDGNLENSRRRNRGRRGNSLPQGI